MKWTALALLLLAAAASAADSKHRGRFYFGPEVQVFEPCTAVKSYWVMGDEKTLKPLRALRDELRARHGRPYQPVYVELIGRLDTTSRRDGFAEDYDGLLHVRKVLRASAAVPKKCRE